MLKFNLGQNRFSVKKQLGQGSFSKKYVSRPIGTIYSAYDNVRREKVALKIEKADKSKKILIFEYQVLKNLQGIPDLNPHFVGLPTVCKLYDFVENGLTDGLNFIVMQMLGNYPLFILL